MDPARPATVPPSDPAPAAPGRHALPAWLTPFNLMLLAVPAAAALKFGAAADLWVFVGCGVALVPLAGLLGTATEGLAARLGATVGGLLNATFGNAAELIIALIVLAHGPDLHPVVKATLTGSIIGNLLLVLGLAIVAGGVRHRTLTFDRSGAGVGATLLAIATAGLLIPTLFAGLFTGGPNAPPAVNRLPRLSQEIAAVLIAVYGLSLVYMLYTRRQPHECADRPAPPPEPTAPHWGVRVSLAVLVAATAGVAVLSEWFVGAIRPAAAALGMNDMFVGVVVVAVVGNAAEHFTAVVMAWRNKMDVAVQIAVGSSSQVALFVAPVLVFASLLMGHDRPLDLHFTPLEVASLALAVGVVALVGHDGEANWLEGAMLVALYVILALAFYNIPPGTYRHEVG